MGLLCGIGIGTGIGIGPVVNCGPLPLPLHQARLAVRN